MKEFKIFVIAVFAFFTMWVVIAYLLAGALVLLSGFSEPITSMVTYPPVIVIPFFFTILGTIFLVDNLNKYEL